MEPEKRFERRVLPIETAELRAVEDEKPKIVGYASKYNNWYSVWDFVERIAPGAFDAALADEDTDVVASMNHNTDFAFARQSAGTLRLTSNTVGLQYEADVTDEDGQRVYSKVRAGTLKGSSFMFTVAEDKWEFVENETPKRTITRIGKLFELGPVVWPANPDTTAKARADEVLAEARSKYMAAPPTGVKMPEKPEQNSEKQAETAAKTTENREKPAAKPTEPPKVPLGPEEQQQADYAEFERQRAYRRKYEKLGRLIDRNRPKAAK